MKSVLFRPGSRHGPAERGQDRDVRRPFLRGVELVLRGFGAAEESGGVQEASPRHPLPPFPPRAALRQAGGALGHSEQLQRSVGAVTRESAHRHVSVKYRLSSDHSFFYATNFATNTKTPQLSELQ